MNNPRNAYREAAVSGGNPVQLVIRLYEQIIQDISQAVKAIETNEIELRTAKINHAILVIAHLQSQLDFGTGPAPARQLSAFYDSVRSGLVRAQFRGSKELLAQQITDLLEVRSAWMEVEREDTGSTSNAPAIAGAAADDAEPMVASWKA
ncbi:MAG TPA: flagellar export chaperone FliS [Terriglobales bacterium]